MGLLSETEMFNLRRQAKQVARGVWQGDGFEGGYDDLLLTVGQAVARDVVRMTEDGLKDNGLDTALKVLNDQRQTVPALARFAAARQIGSSEKEQGGFFADRGVGREFARLQRQGIKGLPYGSAVLAAGYYCGLHSRESLAVKVKKWEDADPLENDDRDTYLAYGVAVNLAWAMVGYANLSENMRLPEWRLYKKPVEGQESSGGEYVKPERVMQIGTMRTGLHESVRVPTTDHLLIAAAIGVPYPNNPWSAGVLEERNLTTVLAYNAIRPSKFGNGDRIESRIGIALPDFVFDPSWGEKVERLMRNNTADGLRDKQINEAMTGSGFMYFLAVRAWREYVSQYGLADAVRTKPVVAVWDDVYSAVEQSIERYKRPRIVSLNFGGSTNKKIERSIWDSYINQKWDHVDDKSLSTCVTALLLEPNNGVARLIKQTEIRARMTRASMGCIDPSDLEKFSPLKSGVIRAETIYISRSAGGYSFEA